MLLKKKTAFNTHFSIYFIPYHAMNKAKSVKEIYIIES